MTTRPRDNCHREDLIPRKKSLVTSVTDQQIANDLVKRFSQ